MKVVAVLLAALLLVWCGQALWAAEEGPTGAPVSESGLKARSDIAWFEDFESPDWKPHWNLGVSEDAQTIDEAKFVFQGRRALAIRSTKGEHGSMGGSVYFPQGFDKLHVRYYVYFPKDFVWGQGRYCHLKLFGLEGLRTGQRWKPTSAGVKPTGTDKFSSRICARPKTGELHFYVYHPDQRGGYGDNRECKAALQRGRWHSLETMLKVNTVGEKDGEVACWLDGKLIGRAEGLRFRTIEDLRIRKARFDNYWGGAGDENTAPVDQVHYIDNIVVATDYIGPAQAQAEGSESE